MNRTYSLSGDINNRGTYTFSTDTTIKEILNIEAGGMKEFMPLKMVQIGGPLGQCLNGGEINKTLLALDESVIAPSIYFFNTLFCPVDYLRFITRYIIREVKHDTKRMRDLNTCIEDVSQGQGTQMTLEMIKMMINMDAETLVDQLCNNVFKSIIFKFEKEILEHVLDSKCANGICRGLIVSQCINACPAGIHIPGYVELMKREKYAEAYALMKKENPLSFICGKVCARPCETRCRRREIESTVGVRALQRFISGKALDIADVVEDKLPLKNKSIGIVGAGPCGLTSAYYLSRTGYDVIIYEAEKHVGGMLAFGIPEYRLPYEDIVKEVKNIEKLGVIIKTNTKIGSDLSFKELQSNHDAVLLATGSHIGNKPPSFDNLKVETAATFLRSVRLENRKHIGKRVLVVGGGDVAMDTARTSLRLGAEEVNVMSLENFNKMPASIEERLQAKEEGINFLSGFGIENMNFDSNIKINYTKCISVLDDDGKFNPIYNKTIISNIEVDSVIMAIGQKPDLEFLNDTVNQQRGFIVVDNKDYKTNLEGVFAAGDVTKPSIAIEAIANGKKAAKSIDIYLKGNGIYTGGKVDIPETPLSLTTWDDPLIEEKQLSVENRIKSFEEVSKTYTLEEAKLEATRCMRCDQNSTKTLLLTPQR